MPELIAVNILIGDRNYRIKIEPKDEEVVRKTVKLVNDKIIEYKTQFAGKDMQDYIAMVLVWFVTEQNETALIELKEAGNGITSIENFIDKILLNK